MLWASIILPITPPVLFEADDQDGVQPQLLGRDALQAAEQRVGRGVGAGQGHAEPAQQGAKERDRATPVWVKARPSVASSPL